MNETLPFLESAASHLVGFLISDFHELKFQPEDRRGDFHLAPKLSPTQVPGIPQDGDSAQGRNRLFEELKTLTREVRALDRQPRDVASGTSQITGK